MGEITYCEISRKKLDISEYDLFSKDILPKGEYPRIGWYRYSIRKIEGKEGFYQVYKKTYLYSNNLQPIEDVGHLVSFEEVVEQANNVLASCGKDWRFKISKGEKASEKREEK